MTSSFRKPSVFNIFIAFAIAAVLLFGQSQISTAQDTAPAPVAETPVETPEEPARAPEEPVPAPEEPAPASEEPASITVPDQPAPVENIVIPEISDQPAPAPETGTESTAPLPTVPIPSFGGEPETKETPESEPVQNENAQTDENAEKTAEPQVPVFWKDRTSTTVIAFLVVLFGSFFLGQFLAKLWRMPDYHIKFFILLFCLFGSIASVTLSWHRMSLGIDLKGGVILVYDSKPPIVDEEKGQRASSYNIDELNAAIKKRVDPAGLREISVQKLGETQVQVIIPQAEAAEVARIERLISEAGTLEFRILASREFDEDTRLIEQASRNPNAIRVEQDGELLAWWVPVSKGEKGQFQDSRTVPTRVRSDGTLEVLVLKDPFDIQGKDMNPGQLKQIPDNENPLQPALGFGFNTNGAQRFDELTRRNAPSKAQPNRFRLLGIIMNGELYSAPRLNSRISGGNVSISFTPRHTQEGLKELQQEITDLMNIMQAGALPAELSKEPVSKNQVGATLGRDTIDKASQAIFWGGIIVLGFMLLYYRFAGLVACFCVIMNLLIIVAVMLAIYATFTLPGLAGLVLTIGMAVDANILIYERMREELRNGASLKMAIRNGFGRATSAIVDSNITTLITAVVLYVVGTEQLKGFAVTLFLGVSFTLFTVLFGARIIFEVFDKWESIKTLHFMQILNRPNYNFMGIRKPVMTVCIVLIVLSLLSVGIRGKGIMNIDFMGGNAVEILLKQPEKDEEVRSKLAALGLQDLSVNPVGGGATDSDAPKTEGEAKSTSGGSNRFMINTGIPADFELDARDYLPTVKKKIEEAFGDNLVYNKLDYEIISDEPVAVQAGATVDENAPVRHKMTVKLKLEPGINSGAIKSQVDASKKNALEKGVLKNDFFVDLVLGDVKETDQSRYPEWTITFTAAPEDGKTMLEQLSSDVNSEPYFPTLDTIGGAVASHTRAQAVLAVVASLLFILIYIRIRFHNFTFGFAAILGLLFNIIITIGLIAASSFMIGVMPFLSVINLAEFKIGLSEVAAFLTIIGYALNDTIILFDRLREIRGKSPKLTLEMINQSINQTLSRTILTGLTTFFVVFILYLFGGQGIRTFAFAMCIGVVVGTFSTMFISAPSLYMMIGTPEEKKETI